MNKLKFLLLILISSVMLIACNEEKSPEASADNENALADTAAVCQDCGTIQSITPVTVKGDSTGVGGVIGAVAGGVLGRQVGGGSGKDVATVVGAVGGAFAGNEIEKRKNAATYYEVTVQMDEGGQRTVTVNSAESISVGTNVKVVGNNLELR